jgi:fatty acid synthase
MFLLQQVGEESRPLWFLCTGWGAQWMGCTKELMIFEVFEHRIKMCSKILENEGINLYDIISSSESHEVPDDFVTVFVTIGATQVT